MPESERFDEDGNPIPIFGGIISKTAQAAEHLKDEAIDLLKEDNHLYKIEYQVKVIALVGK